MSPNIDLLATSPIPRISHNRARPSSPAMKIWAAIVFAPWILFGCGGDSESTQGGGDHGGGSGGPGERGNRPVGPPTAVALETVSLGEISTYYRATASLEADNEAEVQARVSGLVTHLLCEEGDHVRKGQELLRIEQAEYSLRVRQSEAEFEKQRTRFERLEKMRERDLISVEEYSAAENDLHGAEAALELARLEFSYTSVTAPIAGQIVQRTIDVGRKVESGSALFRIADLNPLLARVHVPSKEFRQLETDQQVELRLDSSQAKLLGRISLVSPVIDASTGTIKVTVEVRDYPPGTRPGDFAEVSIVTEKREEVTLVPKVAVVTEKGERLVYVASDSTATRRLVTLGFEDDRFTQILDGVQAGEEIVVQGQRSLKDGAPIKRMEALTFEDDPSDDSTEPTDS